MRVCQLSHVEQTFNFLAPLVHALQARGHTVVAACNLESEGAEARRYLGDGVPLHRVPGGRRVTLRALTVDVLALARYLRRQQHDVVHVHGSLIGVQARLAARLAGVPVVVAEAHGFAFHEGQRSAVRRALMLLERFLCRHLTDVLVVVSEEDAQLAREHGFRPCPEQIVHVPGVGIDAERFRPPTPDERAAARAALGLGQDEDVVLFVGRLVAEKGVAELAAAFAELADRHPRARLVVVGDLLPSERDTSTGPRVLEAWESGPLRERVLLLGRRHDIPQLLRAADVFVLPSYREGMPVALLEAMASGLPVVTTDVRGCREAVVDQVSGLLVPPRDAPALALAVDRLLSSPWLRADLGEAARRRVEERYTVAKSLEPLLRVYAASG